MGSIFLFSYTHNASCLSSKFLQKGQGCWCELINDSSAVRPAVTRGHIDVTRGHIDVTNLAPLQLRTLLLKKKYGLGRLNMCNLLFAK
jgi:hypothetical protein